MLSGFLYSKLIVMTKSAENIEKKIEAQLEAETVKSTETGY